MSARMLVEVRDGSDGWLYSWTDGLVFEARLFDVPVSSSEIVFFTELVCPTDSGELPIVTSHSCDRECTCSDVTRDENVHLHSPSLLCYVLVVSIPAT